MEKKKIKLRDKKALALNIFSGCFGFVILLMLSSFIFRITYPNQLQSKTTNIVEIAVPEPPLPITLINACGTDGIAKKLKAFLNPNRYNVTSTGNLNTLAEKSYIKCNYTNSKILSLAAEIGIDESLVKTSTNNSQNQQITVILGKDYLLLKPFGVK